MKILIDARESGTTTGRYVDKLIEHIREIDSENQYTLLLKTSRLSFYKKLPSNFLAVKCDVKEFTFGEQTKLLWQIVKLRPDLVHFPLVQHPVLYFGKYIVSMLDLTTLRFKNPSKNPTVFWLKQRVYWLVNYIASKKAKRIITISKFVRDDLVRNFKTDSNKIIVTYNSADKITENPLPHESLANKKFIMYVGRHQPHKNLNRLVEAHQKLLIKNPGLVLAIAGKKDATTELLEKNILSNGYKNIVFTGFVSEGQLRWMYENCEAYIFPSLSEGFGLPGLEAMAHDAPVVSSNAACLPEIYGDAAEYFDPLDIDDIKYKIELVLSDSSLRQKLITAGKEQISKYSWRRMAEQTLAIYEEALKS